MFAPSQPPGAGESGVPSAAEGATGPRKRSGTGTAPGSGISGKPAGAQALPHRRSKGRRRVRPESLRFRDRGGQRHRHQRRRMTFAEPTSDRECPAGRPDSQPLKTTPLDAWHRALGARMVPFAGYAMPVQSTERAAAGVMAEHLHCRDAGGAVRCLPHGPGDADRRRLPRPRWSGWSPATCSG